MALTCKYFIISLAHRNPITFTGVMRAQHFCKSHSSQRIRIQKFWNSWRLKRKDVLRWATLFCSKLSHYHRWPISRGRMRIKWAVGHYWCRNKGAIFLKINIHKYSERQYVTSIADIPKYDTQIVQNAIHICQLHHANVLSWSNLQSADSKFGWV